MKDFCQKYSVIIRYIVTFGGIGYSKPMSGTWATLAGLPVAYGFAYIFSPIVLIALSALFYLVGWWAVHVYQKQMDTHDSSEIVIDEICGIFLTLSIVPVDGIWYIVACGIFRVFDIAKPYPICKIDEGKTAFHVMFDDVVAGIFSAIVLWGLLWLNL